MLDVLTLAHAFHNAFPIPLPLVAMAVFGLLLLADTGARRVWQRAPLTADLGAAGTGRALSWAETAARAGAVVGLFLLVVVAAIGSAGAVLNLASIVVMVLFWGGLVLGSAAVAALWPAVSPFIVLAGVVERLRPGTADREPGAGAWAAPVLLGGFVWLQRGYHAPGAPREVAIFLVVYTGLVLVGARRWGSGWVREHEGFAALGRLLGTLAAFSRTGDGRWHRRPALSGLAGARLRPADTAVLLIALGATNFRALTYTPLWLSLAGDRSGWSLSLVQSVGLAWTVATAAVLFVGASRLAERLAGRADAAVATGGATLLVPLVVGLTLAVEGAVLVFSGRLAMVLASDPLGRGWDLFGTIGQTTSLALLTGPGLIYVQVAAVLAAGLLAVVIAHDRTITLLGPSGAASGRGPVFVTTATLTVGGLLLLLGG